MINLPLQNNIKIFDKGKIYFQHYRAFNVNINKKKLFDQEIY